MSQARRRVLVAPVTVSPTKPLTPTHLKYLLSLDMLYRATATFADTAFLYHHATFAGSQQIAGFWAYLDQHHPGLVWEALSEEDIGELYAACHRANQHGANQHGASQHGASQHGASTGQASVGPVARRVRAGWAHPVTARLLDIWRDHYRLLGIFDPELGRSGPAMAGTDEVIDILRSRNLCIDGRTLGAPVYLDATTAGLPLRPVLSPEGQPNYLLYLLRELIPLLGRHDLVVLAHDTEIRADYRTVAHILTALGACVERFEVPRVPINGVAASTRLGGWQGRTLAAFAPPLVEEFGVPAFRLGIRLYLVAGLGRTASESFSVRLLRRWVHRAGRLLAEYGDSAQDPGAAHVVAHSLAAQAARRGYADPYQLAAALVNRHSGVPAGGLLNVLLGEMPGAVREEEEKCLLTPVPLGSQN